MDRPELGPVRTLALSAPLRSALAGPARSVVLGVRSCEQGGEGARGREKGRPLRAAPSGLTRSVADQRANLLNDLGGFVGGKLPESVVAVLAGSRR